MNKEQLRESLDPLIQAYKEIDWDNQKVYEQYLAQTYYYTFHSTRMLAYAASLTNTAQDGYYKRSIKHISEEQGHEKMALNDLIKMGGKLENYPELPTTKAFWQAQYYYINKNNTSLLGYILSLEWLAVEAFPEVYEKVKRLYGPQSSHFIRVHAEEDPEHVDECFEQIDTLTENDKKLVLENFVQSCRMFTLFMKDVENSVKSPEYSANLDNKIREVSL